MPTVPDTPAARRGQRIVSLFVIAFCPVLIAGVWLTDRPLSGSPTVTTVGAVVLGVVAFLNYRRYRDPKP